MDSRSFENESKNMEARSDEKFGQCLAKSVGNRRVYWIFGCWVYAPDDKTKTPVNVIARLTEREEPRSKNFSPLFFFSPAFLSFVHNALYKIDYFFRIHFRFLRVRVDGDAQVISAIWMVDGDGRMSRLKMVDSVPSWSGSRNGNRWNRSRIASNFFDARIFFAS